MTSKERAALRAKSNSLEPLFQVGKGGINDALIAQTDDALRARELIKLKVLLETCPKPPKEIANEIASATGADVVSVVGGSMIFYRYSEELHKKEKEKRDRAKALKTKEKQAKKEYRAKPKNYRQADKKDK